MSEIASEHGRKDWYLAELPPSEERTVDNGNEIVKIIRIANILFTKIL